MRKHTIALSLSALCAAALAAASPQDPTHQGTQPETQSGTHAGKAGHSAQAGKSAGSESFLKQAAAAGMAEVELGQLGSTKATRPEVKDFAQMMVTDHGKANDELKQLASQKNVTLPSEPTAAQKAEKARLEKLSGAAFDSAFMKAMEQDHRKAVSLFSKEASAGKDSDVKQWAGQTLPRLKEHLSKAEQLAGGGATTGTKGTKKGAPSSPQP
jgi:putative membrane protein